MAATPWLYITSQHLYGSHDDGWQQPLSEGEGIPADTDIIEKLPPAVFESKRLSIAMEDDLMLPLQVELEKKVSAKELDQYLLWKLKRHLPYPTEQIALRFTKLGDDQRYLTFSLPKFWLTGLFEALKARGVQAGYIGGAFMTVLDAFKPAKDKLSICVYRDFYLMTQLDKKGNLQWFRTRRLPYNDADQLDLDTWIHADLAPVLEGDAKGKGVIVLDFSGIHNASHGHLQRALTSLGAQVSLYPEGVVQSPLALFRTLVEG